MSQSKGIGPLIKNKLFAGVNPQAIKTNLHQNNFLPYKEGDIIFQTGDKSEHLYLILDGEVKLKILSSMNSSTVREKRKNDFFGDYELADNIPRKSSAVANTDCVLYKLSQKELLDLISRHKAVEETISAERSENTTNIKNGSYQIKQAVMEAAENTLAIPIPAELPIEDSKQSVNDVEKTIDDLKDGVTDGQTIPAPEEIPLPDHTETPGYNDDEDMPDGSIFSAALNGDATFMDEPLADDIPPDEENHPPTVMEPEPAIGRHEEPLPLEKEIDFQKVLFAVKKIHENIELDKIIHSIIEALFSLFDTQIARIFLFDKGTNELWSFPFMDNTGEIKRVKTGEGLIGRSAGDNEIINIINPDRDIRFNYQIDTVENITLEDMLLFPVQDNDKNVIAVIQLINSDRNGFTKQDEEILGILSTDICSAIERISTVPDKVERENLDQLEKLTDFMILDMNTPLSLIKRYAEFIKKKTDIKEVTQVSEFISEQVKSVLTYTGIIANFINGRNALKREVLDLQTTLSSILDMFAEYTESKNVKLFKKLDTDIQVFLDADIFYHACFQLTKNVCDTIPEGGNIYIIAQKEGSIASVEFRGTNTNSDREIKSTTTESLSLPDNEESTRLSLAIANKIIKDHGGEIKVSSDSTEGRSFTISLPVHFV